MLMSDNGRKAYVMLWEVSRAMFSYKTDLLTSLSAMLAAVGLKYKTIDDSTLQVTIDSCDYLITLHVTGDKEQWFFDFTAK